MKVKRSVIESIVYTVLISCMVYICFKSSVDFWFEGKINNSLLYLSILLTAAFCSAVHYTKYALFGLAFILLIPKPLYIVKLVDRMADILPDILQGIIDTGYVHINYEYIFTDIAAMLGVLMTIVCYYMIVKRKRTIIVIIAGAAMYTTYAYYLGKDLEFSCCFFMVCGIMLYAFNTYMKKKKYADKDESLKSGSYTLKWLPSLLIIMILTLLLSPYMPNPVKLKPLSKLEDLIIKITEKIDVPGHGIGNGNGVGTGYFSMSATGFQQSEDRLGGAVKLNDSVAFMVSSEDRINATHMRGVVKYQYTGDVWKFSSLQNEYDANKDFGYDPLLNTDSSQKKIAITYEYNGISTVFSALYPLSVSIGKDKIYRDENMQLSCSDDIKKGEGYTITIKQYTWDKDSLINAKVNTSNNATKQYLELPNNISQRVYELADEITKAYDKPFLKASALEKYLKENYPYSLDTSKLPNNKEFVDYFLFNEKKGSCTYFATAMAVMCRIEGIPTRYIEGFVIPSGNAKEGIEVLNSDAHAWVELYFDDIGWITFDPTPGHYSNSVNPDSPYGENDKPELDVTPDKGDNDDITPAQPQQGEQGGDISPVEQGGDGLKSISVAIWTITGLIFVAAFTGIGMALYYSKGIRRLHYEFFKLTRYGKAIGIAYVPGQSIREYVSAVQHVSGVELEEFLEFYERHQYAKLEDSNEKINKEALNEMLMYVVHKKGRWYALRMRISNPYVYIFKRK